ncbi:PQQ-dependent sugar dehydrogenase [Dyadobacter bucti]|uniref:PQQ-dependent sugar dehydrogenase n=1 Tax=Dyadobacter bucti TaxID=2572203 RepID=UPI0011081C85|nr:PQQ-dependent sugar dehydrogenase [Dyadobacter bucti]
MQIKLSETARMLAVFAGVTGLFAYTSLTTPSLSDHKATNVEAKDIKLPAGFSAEIIAADLGATRHIAVSKTGDIYVKLSKLKDGKGMYILRDANKDGVIDEQKMVGDYPGTGIAIKNGYLYSSSNKGVYRYKLNEKEEIIDANNPEKIVDGLTDHGRDNAKPVALDNNGNIYVTVGSYSDNCRQQGSGKGMSPCTILDSAGGVWKFKADKLNQTFSDGVRYATGVKNAVGIDWDNKTNALYVTVHGRGKFDDFYPQYYTAKHSAELPAETLYRLKEGDDAGWPYIYYDHFQNKKILAPEYGGDGKKVSGEKVIDPLVAFPAHLGPNAMMFYSGNMFPARYKNGAFIAFHSQSAELHKGYLVAFVPFVNGKPGKWEIFADNFAGTDLVKPTGPIQHRPCGLAQGPDGSLYVTDDLNGTIFRINYKKK